MDCCDMMTPALHVHERLPSQLYVPNVPANASRGLTELYIQSGMPGSRQEDVNSSRGA